MSQPQYFNQIKKGFTVSYSNSNYRVQDDGKGYLHIIVFENGKRKKIGIDKLSFFYPGTKADWVFNEWWKIYEWEEFESFANAELAWLND
jgi:hypothetical protein